MIDLAVLWVMAVSVPILLFLPGAATPNRSYAITVAAITGGFLFGIGFTLLFMRLLTGKTLKVVCTNDICQTEN